MQLELDQLNMFGKSKLVLILYGVFLLIVLVALSIIGYPILLLVCIAVATFHSFAKLRISPGDMGRNPFFGRNEGAVTAITVCVYAAIAGCLMSIPESNAATLHFLQMMRDYLTDIAGVTQPLPSITFNPLQGALMHGENVNVAILSSVLAVPVSLAIYFVFQYQLIANEKNKISEHRTNTVTGKSKFWFVIASAYLMLAAMIIGTVFVSWYWLVFMVGLQIHWVFDHVSALFSALVATGLLALAVDFSGFAIAYIVVSILAQGSKSNNQLSNAFMFPRDSRLGRFRFFMQVTFTGIFAVPLGCAIIFLVSVFSSELPSSIPLNWTEEKARIFSYILGWTTHGLGSAFFPLLFLLIALKIIWRSMLSRARDLGFEFNNSSDAWLAFLNSKSGCSLTNLYRKKGVEL